jgi:hypothetical protein
VNHQRLGTNDDALAAAAEADEEADRAPRRVNVLGTHPRPNLFPPKAGLNRPAETLFTRPLAQ